MGHVLVHQSNTSQHVVDPYRSGVQLYWPGMFGLYFRLAMKTQTMSMWPFSAAMCKWVPFCFFVVIEYTTFFISLYFSVSSVTNLTMPRPSLAQLRCNGVHPFSFWQSGSTCCSTTRYLTTSKCACSVAAWSGVLPSWPRHAGLQLLSSIKYLSTSKLPPFAAAWRAVSPYSSFWSGFWCFLSVRNQVPFPGS